MPDDKPATNADGSPREFGDAATGWMEPPRIPATRPCPQSDGLGVRANPERVKAARLLREILAPIKENLEAHGLDFEKHIDKELSHRFLPLPCRYCKAKGQIPMEQPGDPSQVSPSRGPEGLRHLLPGRR